MKKIKLDDIKKENVFQTPPGYFEDLPSIIQAKAMNSQKEAWWLTTLQLPVVKFALPAILVVLLVVFRGSLVTQEATIAEGSVMELMADLSTEELYTYVMDHTDVTHADLLEMATDHQIEFELEEDKSAIEIDEEYIEDLELEDLEELM